MIPLQPVPESAEEFSSACRICARWYEVLTGCVKKNCGAWLPREDSEVKRSEDKRTLGASCTRNA